MANLIEATLHVEADISFLPILRPVYNELPCVPQGLTWCNRSSNHPSWPTDAVIPDNVHHIYSLDLTKEMDLDQSIVSLSKVFASLMFDKVAICQKTASRGKQSRFHFHLWVDPTDQVAMTKFAAMPFMEDFQDLVPQELREDGSITLQLNGESPIPSLPYTVVGNTSGPPL